MKMLTLMCCLATVLTAAESVDPATAYHTEAAKAKEAYDASIAKTTATAVKSLTALAQNAVKKGDMAESAGAWKEVLRLDHANADACAFFTATGNLDQVLAETAASRPLPVPGAGGVQMPSTAKILNIAADSERRLGAVKGGTMVILQYVSGTWGRMRQGGMPLESPDEADSDGFVRLAILDCSTNPPVLLATAPAGTATKVFAFQLTKDVALLGLGILPDLRPNRQGRTSPTSGSVNYKVGLKKP